MANKGLYKYTVAESQNLQLGQGRSAYLDSTNAYTTTGDNAVVAITIIQDCKFTTLTAQYSEFCFGDSGTDATYTDAGVGDQIAATTLFPAGITLYGRWTTVDLASGVAVLYMGA